MSFLPADVHNEINQLLEALQSPDNSRRSVAEAHLANNWTLAKPDMLLLGLVEQMQSSNEPMVRDFKVLSDI